MWWVFSMNWWDLATVRPAHDVWHRIQPCVVWPVPLVQISRVVPLWPLHNFPASTMPNFEVGARQCHAYVQQETMLFICHSSRWQLRSPRNWDIHMSHSLLSNAANDSGITRLKKNQGFNRGFEPITSTREIRSVMLLRVVVQNRHGIWVRKSPVSYRGLKTEVGWRYIIGLWFLVLLDSSLALHHSVPVLALRFSLNYTKYFHRAHPC